MALLNVTDLPFKRICTCTDGTVINMEKFIEDLRPAVDALAVAGLIKASESFGFAMAAPRLEVQPDFRYAWDNPLEFIWFVGGWGPERDRYIANAVRKLRPMFRQGEISTLEMRFFAPEGFVDKVDSVDEDGNFPWGDFPWGGAVSCVLGSLLLEGATSCLKETEDDPVSHLILGLVGSKIIIGDGLLPDD